MKKKLKDIEINPEILSEMLCIQDKLPQRATGANKKGGLGMNYDYPAGLVLLGIKDKLVDTVVPLKMSGGCWDAPNINFDDMDFGLRQLIKVERRCIGMALLRHPRWSLASGNDDAKIPDQLKRQLHTLRNSFEDITATVWMVLHNNYFRVYRPTQSGDGRVGAREISIKSLISKDNMKDIHVKSKIKKDMRIKNDRLKAKKEALRQKEEREKRWAAEERREQARERAHQKKIEAANDKLNEAKEDYVDIGGGYTFMKSKTGEYILWQTSTP